MAQEEYALHFPVEEPPESPWMGRPGEGPEDDIMEVVTEFRVDTPKIVSRSEWGAVPPREVVPAIYPLTRLFLTVYTGSKGCDSHDTCTRVVREMQKYHMETLGLADIKYNFLIGGDGKVYEGRGWYYRSSKSLQFNPVFYDQRLDIAYIGDYRDCPDGPPLHMRNTAVDLLDTGTKEGYLEDLVVSPPNTLRGSADPGLGSADFV